MVLGGVGWGSTEEQSGAKRGRQGRETGRELSKRFFCKILVASSKTHQREYVFFKSINYIFDFVISV
jgi:hypothetical protein